MKLIYFYTLGTILLATGCNNGSYQPDAPGASHSPLVMDAAPPTTVDSHAHPTEGPHHGTLIELGNEKYHAELVHDKQSVTVYILDGTATKPIPVEATEVTINLVHNGKPAQFKLSASSDLDDPPGKSSRFVLQDANLVEELEHDQSAKLSVLILGKAYRGDIQHDHAGHDHGHAH